MNPKSKPWTLPEPVKGFGLVLLSFGLVAAAMGLVLSIVMPLFMKGAI